MTSFGLQKIMLARIHSTINYYSEVVDRMFDFLKTEYKDQEVPEAIWVDLSDVKTTAIKDITEMLIQSYEGHFTPEELNEMIAFHDSEVGMKILMKSEIGPEEVKIRDAFYSSELGQKIVSSSESLNTILQKITQEWSAQLFKNVQQKLSEKGYTKG